MSKIKNDMVLIKLIEKLSIYFRTVKFNDNKDTLVNDNELLSNTEHRKSLIHSFILDCNISDEEVEILSDDEVCLKLVHMACSLSDVKLQNKIANITSEYSDELILSDFYDFVGAKSNDSKMAVINFLTAQYFISKGIITPYNRTIFICKDNATAEKIKEVLMYITNNFYHCNLQNEYDIFSNNIVITTDSNYDIHAGVTDESCVKNTNVVNVDLLSSKTDCFDVFIDLARKHQKEFDIFFINLYGTVLVLQHKNSYV